MDIGRDTATLYPGDRTSRSEAPADYRHSDHGVDWETVPYCDCDEAVVKRYLLRSGDLIIAVLVPQQARRT